MIPEAVRLVLLALVMLGGSLWIGGMAAIIIVSRASRAVLKPADRVALFIAAGPRFFAVTGTALVVAAACGVALLADRGWNGLATAIAVLLAVLMATLAIGVRQARAMRRLRMAAQGNPADAAAHRAVTSAARRAALLRFSLAVISLAVFVLALATAD